MSTEIKDKDIELPQDTHGESCSNCKYWFELQNNEPNSGLPIFGKCKKNPPAMLVQDEKTYSGHPITSETDWCGAWGLKFKPVKQINS
jgi:hypothetical protein